jgi:hypothetical protein
MWRFPDNHNHLVTAPKSIIRAKYYTGDPVCQPGALFGARPEHVAHPDTNQDNLENHLNSKGAKNAKKTWR